MSKIITIIALCICSYLPAQQTMGLFINDAQAFDGYTLLSNNEVSYLIDNCGFVVNRWESDFKPGASMYLLENGNLLRTARVSGAFSAGGLGGRFELFSWDGDLLWGYDYASDTYHAHHDIAPLPNGHFLAIAWEKHSEAEAQAMGKITAGDIWSEKVIEIEMIGDNQANIVWEWRLWDHLIQDADSNKDNFGVISEHPELVDINFPDPNIGEDWIHLNGIDYNPELDQIALSSRNMSEIWIIDHSTTTEEAASSSGGEGTQGGDLLYRFGNPQAYQRGSDEDQTLSHLHNVQWIIEGDLYQGQLMVFNNNFAATQSSIEIWQPSLINNSFQYNIEEGQAFGPSEITYTYTNDSLFSRNQSGSQLLPNGNLFICQAEDGHLFEVSPDGTLVWDYINPVNRNGGPGIQGGTPHFNELFRATRYAPTYAAFSGRILNPGLPIELLPLASNCELFTGIDSNINPTSDQYFKIINNLSANFIRIESLQEIASRARLSIYDLSGRLLLNSQITKPVEDIDMGQFPSGMYLLVLEMGGYRQSVLVLRI